METFDHPIRTLVLSSLPAEDLVTELQQDYIFDASNLAIDTSFVAAYTALLGALASKGFSRVLVVQNTTLSLFPDAIVVVPTLGEAEDIIEMERIERDLGF